jgi:hypothetical protein
LLPGGGINGHHRNMLGQRCHASNRGCFTHAQRLGQSHAGALGTPSDPPPAQGEADIKYIDPSYMIRSVPTTSNDRIYCKVLGQGAVHGAFAGYTDITVGLVNTHYVYLPIPMIIQAPRKVWARLTFCVWGRRACALSVERSLIAAMTTSTREGVSVIRNASPFAEPGAEMRARQCRTACTRRGLDADDWRARQDPACAAVDRALIPALELPCR